MEKAQAQEHIGSLELLSRYQLEHSENDVLKTTILDGKCGGKFVQMFRNTNLIGKVIAYILVDTILKIDLNNILFRLVALCVRITPPEHLRFAEFSGFPEAWIPSEPQTS